MSGEFLNLDVFQRQQLQVGIIAAVEGSFIVDGSRRTQSETRRRVGICMKRFREMRGQLGWSIQHICDELPVALRNTIDGRGWDPSKRRAWWGAQPT